jgi:hypothetical protein
MKNFSGYRGCFLVLPFVVATLIGCGSKREVGRDSGTTAVMQTSWQQKITRAKDFATKHDNMSFRELLTLIGDAHDDVAYAAAEAIEERGDVQFSAELRRAIALLPREKRWPGYRALRKYPERATVEYLISALDEELAYHSNRPFDERNSFYIAGSLSEIIGGIAEYNVRPTIPTGRSRPEFLEFLRNVKNITGR